MANALSRKYQRGYDLVKRLRKLLASIPSERPPPSLTGLAGELLAKKELSERGVCFQPQGRQGSYDILLTEQDRAIEVKTSKPKNDGLYAENILFYGWTIQKRDRQGQPKPPKFDFLVCVALDEDLERPKYYLFKQAEALRAGPVRIPRFKRIMRKLYLFRNGKELREAVKSRPGLVTAWEREVNANRRVYLNRWRVLTES